MFPTSEFHQLFLALVIGGMCAGAITVNAAHFATVVAFILPATLPLAASFLAEGPPWRVPALMVVIFATALSAISLIGHRTFGDHVRLQIALRRERCKVHEVNQQMLDEMAQRLTAEATLHQAQKMEAIGHLTGGFAHDFNNLLQVVIGNVGLIRRLAADNARIVGYAQAAEQAATRGAELTSTLLSFARRQALAAKPVGIDALLREFEPILLRTLGPLIRFEMVLEPNLPLCQADPAHFQSAVLNLVINARDAMPAGGVVSVKAAARSLGLQELAGNPNATPGRFVSVAVRDSGIGMSQEVMARVFEPFFTTKEVGKGSGLGLSQVYGFAGQSGGHVGISSTPNNGTEVTLWLPVSNTSGAAREVLDPARHAPDAAGGAWVARQDLAAVVNGPRDPQPGQPVPTAPKIAPPETIPPQTDQPDNIASRSAIRETTTPATAPPRTLADPPITCQPSGERETPPYRGLSTGESP
jgi:signal transduction histidine kinase